LNQDVRRDAMSKVAVLSLAVIICFVAVCFAADTDDGTSPEKRRCPVCRMFVSLFADWNARIELKDSTDEVFDGSKCMFKYYLDPGRYTPSKSRSDVRTISVKDYYSKADIDAREAFFVIWGDVYGPMGHEPIPFEKEADAKKFLEEHKGKKILRFGDIDQDLITALDNP
jgi:copper chaperone NosL